MKASQRKKQEKAAARRKSSEQSIPVRVMAVGEHTTYDFGTKTFGHATMLVGPFDDKFHPALLELQAARKRLIVEEEKMRRGEPYDRRFVHGNANVKVWPYDKD
jgi:hypothetical protein